MFPIVCIQTLPLDIFSNVTIHNDYLAASLVHLLLFTGPYPKLNLELASYFAKQSSRRQTCPRKTDHPTDPRLRRCHLQNSLQHSANWMQSITVPSVLSPKHHILPTSATCMISLAGPRYIFVSKPTGSMSSISLC